MSILSANNILTDGTCIFLARPFYGQPTMLMMEKTSNAGSTIEEYNKANLMKKNSTKVIIIDDHDGIRAGIKSLLEKARDIRVVGEGSTGLEAIRLAEKLNPDLVLLDVELPILRGEEVMKRIRKTHPTMMVLAVSSYDDRPYVQGMLENGASGYITKEEAPEFLVKAIQEIVRENRIWLSPRVALRTIPLANNRQTLTVRELEMLKLLGKGKSEKEISKAMNIEPDRLKKYLRILKFKFEVTSNKELKEIANELNPRAP